ncbi:hypothetical protein JTE90_016513 [Oedothorax gibbosus]|uniref:Folylpolyglutamate synthase n=1 Tax=Oedothorax gibbosus TaxID=931172 RepID=A0AAV6U4E4_9ARAC|nr:hypothetical protein JTE90_016513 [Oedothorax gibbosus]
MDSKAISVYEEAVYALNGLQSNAALIKKSAAERSTKAYLSVVNTEKYLKILGIKMENLNALNVIHVAGTKGKGSTCAFTESVLRKHGYKTGFYSSPHLISVNERIRINGLPLPKEAFASYFWEVYKNIQQNLAPTETMPAYFMFLTIMAFYVFVKEQVQAAVIEVGLGGLYDCTNILRKPVAVGITTLGLDHVNLLGDTIALIAEQKAGIMKPGVPAFTVPQQESAMKVLRDKATKVGCPLFLSPPIEAYEKRISLGIQGIVQNVNVSLALQLTNAWLRHQTEKSDSYFQTLDFDTRNKDFDTEESLYFPLPMAQTFQICDKTRNGLENCVWPGRFQTVERGRITYFLDGAHTHQSMKYCARWFAEISSQHSLKYQKPPLKILLFNCTGDRRTESLLDPLSDLYFDLVIFSPNRINVMKDASSDLSNFMVEPEKEIQQCNTNKEVWCHLMRSVYENELSISSMNSISPKSQILSSSAIDNILQFSSLSEVLNFVTSLNESSSNVNKSFTELITSANHIQVLVTGSLHLVGGILSLLES